MSHAPKRCRRPWFRGRRFLVMLQLLVLTMPAATAKATTSSPVPAIQTQTVLARTDEMWRYLGDGFGGYSDIPRFAEPPLLHTIAGNLAVAEQLGMDVARIPGLDRPRRVRHLEELLLQPGQERVWFKVEVVEMATQALIDLGAPPSPATVATQLQPLRADWGFAWNPNEPSHWSATSFAVRAITAVGGTVPAATAEAAAARLEEVVAAAEEDWDGAEDFIAVWAVADRVLPVEQRAPWQARIAPILRSRAEVLAGPTCNGFGVLILNQIVEIAEANEVPLPGLDPAPCFEHLSSVNGYLVDGGPEDLNAAVTAVALELGWDAPPRLGQMVRMTAGPLGWRGEIFRVDAESTSVALAIRHALGVHERDGEVRRLAATWLADLTARLGRPEELRQQLRSDQYVVLLAHELDLPVDDAGGALRRLLADPGAADWEPLEFVFLLRLATLLSVEVPEAFGRAAEDAILAFPLETINDLTSLIFLNEAFRSPRAEERMTAAANLLEIDAGLFAWAITSDVPDLRATATGLYATGRLAAAGPEALPTFVTEEGVAQSPPQAGFTTVVNIRTSYTGLVLQGAIRSDRWLV